MSDLKKYVESSREEMYALLKELCLIPAPSHHEEKRAEYCKRWLEENGAEGVYIDSALNVIFPLNCGESSRITAVIAHTDTVFPDREPFAAYRDDGEKIFCPGVGDDTASLSVLLMTARYFVKEGICPPDGMLFVCNSCEEGLGNLKGVRQLFQDFQGRIAQLVSFDSVMGVIHDRCVGSHRYEVTVLTEGGHSFEKFGNANAIEKLAEMIAAIYRIQVPKEAGSTTTYNVGTVSGGTSVNTIAQRAAMLCEYRSDDARCLAVMKENFERIFEEAKSDRVTVEVREVGVRPCRGNVDQAKMDVLVESAKNIVEEVTGKAVECTSASTDCNIPLSLGVPAIAMGVYNGRGAHTREEWVEKASLGPGLEIGIRTAMKLMGVET